MRWFKKPDRTGRVNPEDSLRQAEATKRRIVQQQPLVNRLKTYAQNREGQNGFGEDVEFTFRPRSQG